MQSYLFLIRHGESEWNQLGLWTGWVDVNLTDKGVEEARTAAGKMPAGVQLHSGHVSPFKRAKQTLGEFMRASGQDFPVTVSGALNERDYGDYTGKNKWEVQKEIGEEAFTALRRGWDVRVPGGETLKMVHDRVLPYFEQDILPELRDGKNVVIAAHGNTLRALMKHLESVPPEEIHKVEIGTGEVVAYEFNEDSFHRNEL